MDAVGRLRALAARRVSGTGPLHHAPRSDDYATTHFTDRIPSKFCENFLWFQAVVRRDRSESCQMAPLRHGLLAEEHMAVMRSILKSRPVAKSHTRPELADYCPKIAPHNGLWRICHVRRVDARSQPRRPSFAFQPQKKFGHVRATGTHYDLIQRLDFFLTSSTIRSYSGNIFPTLYHIRRFFSNTPS